ncbi:MAG: sulfurtransferase TusA family protein [Thiohalobacterales bacterium]|nr:sulfurtransferase TusA family protein [Thiohalobacterales bacterium]
MSDTRVDARNLLCPMPVIRTQDAVAACTPGDRVQVFCTDPGVVHDIPAWCRVHGHEVCGITQDENEIVIDIRVGENA